jgi:PAS domain S-box-containing protein
VPPGLEAICLRALAKDQAARWASATELGQAVQGWQDAQRRQAEEALRASEERYRTLAEAVPHIVWTARPDGLLDYVNRRGFEYSGMTSTEAMGEAWQKMVHPDDLSVSLERWRSALATGNEYEVEFRLRRCDGTFRWFLSRAVPIRDAEGRIVKWFGTCTDIDDQKRVEAALRASEEQYHLLADAVPQIVWAADRDGRNTFWNQRGHEYSGLSGADAAGAGWQAVMHPDDLPRLVENWQESVRTGRPQDFEFRLRRADGFYRWFLGRAVPVRDGQGQIVKWIGTCTDINDKKCPRQLT